MSGCAFRCAPASLYKDGSAKIIGRPFFCYQDNAYLRHNIQFAVMKRSFLFTHILPLTFFLLALVACSGPTHTIKNMKEALSRESGESLSYTLFAHKAQQEGLKNLETLFTAAAFSQQIHVDFYAHLLDGWDETDYAPENVTVDKVASTLENLNTLIMAQQYEADSIFPRYIAMAAKEKADSAVIAFTHARQAKLKNVSYFRGVMKMLTSSMDAAHKAGGTAPMMAVSINDNIPSFWSLCPVCGALYNDMADNDTQCSVCHTPAAQFDHFPRY